MLKLNWEKGKLTMMIEEPKPLPCKLCTSCYACAARTATHVCRYRIKELTVQVCLCSECMKLDTLHLLKNTIGIRGLFANIADEDLLESPGSRLTS